MDELDDINGNIPNAAGKICNAFLCQNLRIDGRIEDRADITHVCFEGAWFRLYFEPFMVFWRASEEAPVASDEPGYEFELRDVGNEAGIVGVKLVGLSHCRSNEWIEARFQFENGKVARVRHDQERADVILE